MHFQCTLNASILTKSCHLNTHKFYLKKNVQLQGVFRARQKSGVEVIDSLLANYIGPTIKLYIIENRKIQIVLNRHYHLDRIIYCAELFLEFWPAFLQFVIVLSLTMKFLADLLL